MRKPTLIAGTNGHDTVIRTSNESPACGRMSTSARGTRPRGGPRHPVEKWPRDGHARGDSRAGDVPKRRRLQIREEVGRLQRLRRPLMNAENPVTASRSGSSPSARESGTAVPVPTRFACRSVDNGGPLRPGAGRGRCRRRSLPAEAGHVLAGTGLMQKSLGEQGLERRCAVSWPTPQRRHACSRVSFSPGIAAYSSRMRSMSRVIENIGPSWDSNLSGRLLRREPNYSAERSRGADLLAQKSASRASKPLIAPAAGADKTGNSPREEVPPPSSPNGRNYCADRCRRIGPPRSRRRLRHADRPLCPQAALSGTGISRRNTSYTAR